MESDAGPEQKLDMESETDVKQEEQGNAPDTKTPKSAKKPKDGAASSESEKLKVLQEKYQAQKLELRAMEKELNLSKRRETTLQRERDLLSTDLKKGAAVREKLELLCRELQKQNKNILEDSKRSAEEEAAKRAELSAKFEGCFKGIQEKLEGQGEERLRIIKENDSLRGHLENLLHRAELEKDHIGKVDQAAELQRKLLEAQLAEAAHGRTAEEAKVAVYKAELEVHRKRERELLDQISGYVDKFSEVEKMLQDSNAMFAKFRAENDKLGKELKKSVMDNLELKKKTVSSDAALIRLLEERKEMEGLLKKAKGRSEKLEALCRTLQGERKVVGAAGAGGAGGGPAPDTPPGKGDVLAEAKVEDVAVAN